MTKKVDITKLDLDCPPSVDNNDGKGKDKQQNKKKKK